jgi:hypothetical protein
MKFWIFAVLFSVSAVAHAESVLVRAPSASPLTFENFIKQNPQAISYVEFQQRRMQNQPDQESQIFSLADSFSTSPELTVLHLKGLMTKSPSTLMSLRFVRDLAEKSSSAGNAGLRRDLQSLYCKTAVLLNEGALVMNCATQFVSLETLKKKFPKADKVVIESLGFALTDVTSPTISSQSSYHWTFISNSSKPVSFYGTYEQLFQQSFSFQDIVAGSCDGFTSDFEDLSVQTQSRIYFSDSCQKSAAMPEGNSKFAWLKEERTWWIAAGLVVLGGVAYSMKDKKVVVNPNGLKF